MYSRYMAGNDNAAETAPASLPGAAETGQDAPLPFQDVTEEDAGQAEDSPTKKSGLLQSLFGGNVKLPDVNADTVLLLVLVYFLVADESENISDTLLIIGVLLLLGF